MKTGEVRVRMTGIGRLISFRSDELLDPSDRRVLRAVVRRPRRLAETPNRISAGTFHPNERGRPGSMPTAAADPAKYPILSVTAEPGDGNSGPTGPEVLRLDSGDGGAESARLRLAYRGERALASGTGLIAPLDDLEVCRAPAQRKRTVRARSGTCATS